MGRRKQAVAQRWNAINKQRAKDIAKEENKGKKEISEEEHEKRIQKLKELGLIK